MPALILFVLAVAAVWLFDNWGWYIFGAIGVLGAATMGALLWHSQTPAGREEARKYEEEQREQERKKAEREKLPERFAGGPKHVGQKGRIALDLNGKTLAVFRRTGWEFIPFAHVRGARLEIVENGVTHTTGSRSLLGAAVGGLAFGVGGAVVGGLGGRTQSRTIKAPESVRLLIQVRDLSSPQRTVQFGSYSSTLAKWTTTDADVARASEWLSRIEIIVEDNERSKSASIEVADVEIGSERLSPLGSDNGVCDSRGDAST